MKKVIVAIDSFKGCLTSAEANQAAARGILDKMPEAKVVQVPPPNLPLEIALQPATAKENIKTCVIKLVK